VDQRWLVERARKGDHDAFAELARAAVVRLDRAARLILRDPELARDAVQDGLIRAWRDLPGLRDPGAFDGWLHRLTVNACLDLARRRRRRPIEVELSPIHHPAVVDAAAGVERRELIDSVLRSLDPGGRAIVVLHYYLGMPLPEVATTLRIPVGTVKSRLHRALGTMRIAIDAESDVPQAAAVTGGQLA
jgi:RNA polymerase sigma-70 factor (ECF subfamily)